jgi:hypothetical protein
MSHYHDFVNPSLFDAWKAAMQFTVLKMGAADVLNTCMEGIHALHVDARGHARCALKTQCRKAFEFMCNTLGMSRFNIMVALAKNWRRDGPEDDDLYTEYAAYLLQCANPVSHADLVNSTRNFVYSCSGVNDGRIMYWAVQLAFKAGFLGCGWLPAARYIVDANIMVDTLISHDSRSIEMKKWLNTIAEPARAA